MKQILLTLVFAVVNTWSAWALDFCFRHLNTSNGLPNQQVEAIVQDADGYIWIGTRNGPSLMVIMCRLITIKKEWHIR